MDKMIIIAYVNDCDLEILSACNCDLDYTAHLKFETFPRFFTHVFLITVHIHEGRPYGVTGNV